jgi:hypothetical protein
MNMDVNERNSGMNAAVRQNLRRFAEKLLTERQGPKTALEVGGAEPIERTDT